MVKMQKILALVDDIQAGDCSELAEHPINITPGKTLVTQLNIYTKNRCPRSSPANSELAEALREDFSQPKAGSASTRICGRVSRSRRSFYRSWEHDPKGTTVIELLAIANGIPVSLWYSFEGDVDIKVPAKGDPIRAEGKLYCEPGFTYGVFYSPVKADIIETTMLKMEKGKHEVQDWGILKLRLRIDISRFDLVGDNLKEGGKFVRLSSYNPPPSFWQAYLKRVYGSRWKRIWKKTKEGN